jgi:hypothetical protein
MSMIEYETSLGLRFETVWRLQQQNKGVTFSKDPNISRSNEILVIPIANPVTPKAERLSPLTNKI